MNHRFSLYAALCSLACSGATSPPPDVGEPSPAPAPPAPAASAGSAAPPGSAAPAATPSAVGAAPAAEPSTPGAAVAAFPPKNFSPPFERSARPGDGQWSAFAAAGTPADVLYRTEVHPHDTSRFLSVTVVAVDLTRAALRWLPGTGDVEPKRAPKDLAVGVVPESEQERLLAVFNGGFQPAHGRWGIRIAEFQINPPKPHGCTVALAADGSVRIQTWSELEKAALDLHVVRQTPPCLVENGELHPDLLANRERAWGGNVPDVVTRRRSAIGLDRTRRVLFYGVGIEVGARLLAEGMRYAGAVEAAELDINWNWTRFMLFGKPAPDAPPRVTATLLPDMPHGKTTYVARKADRDFFYLLSK